MFKRFNDLDPWIKAVILFPFVMAIGALWGWIVADPVPKVYPSYKAGQELMVEGCGKFHEVKVVSQTSDAILVKGDIGDYGYFVLVCLQKKQ